MTKHALEPTHFPFFDYTGYSFSLGLETPAGIWLSGHTASRYAAELDRMVVAGQGAINPERNEIEYPGDIVGQTRYVYRNLMKVLAAAGVGPEAVVKTIEFVTPAGLHDYRNTAHVRREFFQTPLPADRYCMRSAAAAGNADRSRCLGYRFAASNPHGHLRSCQESPL
jgi:enamine deaminase RidA (YjgF/YER057c/UK114 family)